METMRDKNAQQVNKQFLDMDMIGKIGKKKPTCTEDVGKVLKSLQKPMIYVMIWAWVQLMWLLIFTEISGTYTTECGALTLASIMNYRYSLTTRLQLGITDGQDTPSKP
jgi:uncharacterized membrane protein (DUF106 family)